MTISLFANRLPGLTRIALMQDGRIEKLRLHRDGAPSLGSVYRARVVQVDPGMQAAFCDIGQDENVFLDKRDLPVTLLPTRKTPIETVLREGRMLLVQLVRGAHSDKLARVGAEIKLPGFFSVFMPLSKGIHFSKNFAGDRDRFREIVGTAGGGWIIRSAAAGIGEARFRAEVSALEGEWKQLGEQSQKGSAGLIRATDPLLTAIRDQGLTRLDNIFVDDEGTHRNVQDFTTDFAPELSASLQWHLEPYPIFDVYGIESEIDSLRAAKINLPSGGWLLFQRTEAMTVVDVNSGKARKDRGGKSAALRTNLEAAREIARQVRVRNLSGLIVIDFIEARERSWRSDLDSALRTAFRDDDARHDLLPINPFGLAHISRERTEPALDELLSERCPCCWGSARIDTHETRVLDIQKNIIRQAENMAGTQFAIGCARALADVLTQRFDELLAPLEQRYDIGIRIVPKPMPRSRPFTIDIL